MAVDLNACVGCAACVVACQSENNIPIVGKARLPGAARCTGFAWTAITARGRTTGIWASRKSPSSRCSASTARMRPCEYVCPVNATVHDDEGLNLMVYTAVSERAIARTTVPTKSGDSISSTSISARSTGFTRGRSRPRHAGPDSDGEKPGRDRADAGRHGKCTYCVQRIEQAKIAQKIKARDSGDVRVPDGAVTPACAQACPAGALIFGDIRIQTAVCRRSSSSRAITRSWACSTPSRTRPIWRASAIPIRACRIIPSSR